MSQQKAFKKLPHLLTFSDKMGRFGRINNASRYDGYLPEYGEIAEP